MPALFTRRALVTLVLFGFFTTPLSYGASSPYPECIPLSLKKTESSTEYIVEVVANTCKEFANAVEIHLSLSPSLTLYEVESPLMDIFPLPQNVSSDKLILRYVTLTPFTGEISIARVTFTKVDGEASGDANLLPESLLLLADGQGTTIFAALP